MQNSDSIAITRAEAAKALGVDPRTITAGIENGSIPSVKLCRRVLIPGCRFWRYSGP
ncbi:DNA-binding protein [Rhodococcus opacus]|nr:DNA-binding protein [Rhodococcus opacus]